MLSKFLKPGTRVQFEQMGSLVNGREVLVPKGARITGVTFDHSCGLCSEHDPIYAAVQRDDGHGNQLFSENMARIYKLEQISEDAE